MDAAIELRVVRIRDENEEARLVFWDDALVALLLRLSDEYESDAGKWHLEWVQSDLGQLQAQTFDSLSIAQNAIQASLHA